MKLRRIILSIALASAATMATLAIDNIAEEVAWIIGDEPIYKSEIEQQYLAMKYEHYPINGDPYCVIPELMAIEKLFLHQADIDTIEVPDSQVQMAVDSRLNSYIFQLGSREALEKRFRKSYPEIRAEMIIDTRNQFRISEVQRNLTKDVKVTPSDVRRYFDALPLDSIPYVPMQVQVQIITINPVIPREEIEAVKGRLRELTDRINRNDGDFSTLAIYSEDVNSDMQLGEIGFKGRAELTPEYAAVAFNLNDPKKVSKIVEDEYGFHIIQLIEKRGDRINTRHILLRPKVAQKDLDEAVVRLDSVRTEILEKDIMTFEDAARIFSQDKDTRLSRGVMVNEETRNTYFQMSQLPQEISKVVDTLQVGQVSKAFVMRDPRRNREIVAIVKLTNRIGKHRATLSDDYELAKTMCEQAMKEKIINNWLTKKINDTYVRIEEGWRNCDFTHKGWLKNQK